MSYEQLVCHMPTIRPYHGDRIEMPIESCGEDVVVISTACGDPRPMGDPSDVWMPEAAWSSSWQIECNGGHVLSTIDMTNDISVPHSVRIGSEVIDELMALGVVAVRIKD